MPLSCPETQRNAYDVKKEPGVLGGGSLATAKRQLARFEDVAAFKLRRLDRLSRNVAVILHKLWVVFIYLCDVRLHELNERESGAAK